MCDSHKSVGLTSGSVLILSGLMGMATGWLDIAFLNQAGAVIADIFIRLLKLVSLPIIFFSLLATLSSMGGTSDVKALGGKVLKYTLTTTLLAASLALGLYLLFDPAQTPISLALPSEGTVETVNYWHYLLSLIPENFIAPFYNNNVMGVLFLALVLSAATLSLRKDHKESLNQLFESLFAAVMKMTGFFLKLMPLAVWAFVNLFVQDVQNQETLQGLALYLCCVLTANLLQAGVVLPTLLKAKGLSPISSFRAMMPALAVAFFSKSSSAALPSAIDCAEQRMGVDGKVARFSMPLCITVNMNACAAYILITVLFVCQSNGIQFSGIEFFSWILIATLAAIGNAGVPMGCYMLSSAFLAAMGVDMKLMVLILPFYAFIDMLESAINVWSDSCVTAMVNSELKASSTALEENLK